MKESAQEHLTRILKRPHTPLAQIYQAYQAHKNLAIQLQEDLPEEYKNSVSLILYRGGVLHLGVTSSAMKARLMYEREGLLLMLRKKSAWAGIKEVKIKITSAC